MWQCLIELNNIHSVAWRVLPFLGWYVPQRNSHGHSLQRYTWGCSGLPQWLRGKESTCNSGHTGFSLWVWKIPLEEGMATPSSILARKIPRTEEPSRLWSMGSQRVRHDKHTHFEVSSVQFSCSVVSDPLWPHELQHTRSPCPSPIPRVYSNSCPLSRWCHSSVVSFSSCLLSSQHQGLLNESVLHIRWPSIGSFSFSISPYNEYSGLISFMMDWFGSPCSPRNSQESSSTPQFKSINSLALSFLYGPTLTFIHDHWKNHSFD